MEGVVLNEVTDVELARSAAVAAGVEHCPIFSLDTEQLKKSSSGWPELDLVLLI